MEQEKDFPQEVKNDILKIINDSPTLVKLGDKEYKCTNMKFYTLNRICQIASKFHHDGVDKGDKLVKALCTDIDAMCEILAVILCNHLFVPDRLKRLDDVNEVMSYNDRLVCYMKAKIMNSTYDVGQWAAIIIGAFKSIDLSSFFFLTESVSQLTDSMTQKRTMSSQILSSWKEAQSLAMQQTSSKTIPNTP